MFSVFVFRRFGIIVPFLPAPFMLAIMLAVKLFSGDTRKFGKIPWAVPLALAMTGVATVVIGLLLERWQKRSEALIADEFYLFEPADTFMFVRIKYWGFIWLAFALFFYLRLSNIIG
jgi:hypothetical protein